MSLKVDPCNGGKYCKESKMVLLACHADRADKLPPLVIGKTENPGHFKNVRNLTINYGANRKI
jgi:hypothetical protein